MKQFIQKISENITRFVYTQKESLINYSWLIENAAVRKNNYYIASYEAPFEVVDVQLIETPVVRYSS